MYKLFDKPSSKSMDINLFQNYLIGTEIVIS